jgi:hypothetical protein
MDTLPAIAGMTSAIAGTPATQDSPSNSRDASNSRMPSPKEKQATGGMPAKVGKLAKAKRHCQKYQGRHQFISSSQKMDKWQKLVKNTQKEQKNYWFFNNYMNIERQCPNF